MLIFFKNANRIIFWLFTLASFICVIYAAISVSEFAWWLMSPSAPALYISDLSLAKLDNSLKYINNRNPFGIVIAPLKVESKIESTPVTPVFHLDLSGIKVNGSYLAAESTDSFAFLRVTNTLAKGSNKTTQSLVAQIGDQILPGIFLTQIKRDAIVITADESDAVINFSGEYEESHGIDVEDVRKPIHTIHQVRPLLLGPGPVIPIKEPLDKRIEQRDQEYKASLINTEHKHRVYGNSDSISTRVSESHLHKFRDESIVNKMKRLK